MIFQYTYSLDLFSNGVTSSTFASEIRESVIVTALDRIDTDETSCLVFFKEELSDSDELVLEELVSEHSGELEKPSDFLVKIQEETEGGKTQGHFQSITLDIETTGAGVVTKDMSFPFPI